MTAKLQVEGHKLLYHLDRLVEWDKGNIIYPIHLDIGATSQCNYRCIHCFYNYQGHKPYELEEKRLLGLMKEISDVGVKSIYFASNGEPLLNKAVPNAIVDAKKNGIDVALSTNGVLLTKNILGKILSELSWIRISILALSQELYCKLHKASSEDWRNLLRNIEDAVAIKTKNGYSLTIGAQMCLLSENGKEAVLLAKKLKEIGLNYLVIRPVSQNYHSTFNFQRNLIKENFSILKEAESLSTPDFIVSIRWNAEKEEKTYNKCYGLPFIACIAADGGCYACGCHLEEEDYCYGNIYDKSFAEIWQSEQCQKTMRRIMENPDWSKCDILCRHHSINKFLWGYKNPPEHINFI